jgi:hypothetical protein
MKKKIKNIFFEFGRKNTVKWVFFISQLWSLLDRLKVVTFKPSLIIHLKGGFLLEGYP